MTLDWGQRSSTSGGRLVVGARLWVCYKPGEGKSNEAASRRQRVLNAGDNG